MKKRQLLLLYQTLFLNQGGTIVVVLVCNYLTNKIIITIVYREKNRRIEKKKVLNGI